MYENEMRGCGCPQPIQRQRHVHEITGSTLIAENCENPHNHRFTAVIGEAITSGANHVHEVKFRTDFRENHFHEFIGRTGSAVVVENRHVHYIEDSTTMKNGHRHEFRVATLIENPIEP